VQTGSKSDFITNINIPADCYLCRMHLLTRHNKTSFKSSLISDKLLGLNDWQQLQHMDTYHIASNNSRHYYRLNETVTERLDRLQLFSVNCQFTHAQSHSWLWAGITVPSSIHSLHVSHRDSVQLIRCRQQLPWYNVTHISKSLLLQTVGGAVV